MPHPSCMQSRSTQTLEHCSHGNCYFRRVSSNPLFLSTPILSYTFISFSSFMADRITNQTQWRPYDFTQTHLPVHLHSHEHIIKPNNSFIQYVQRWMTRAPPLPFFFLLPNFHVWNLCFIHSWKHTHIIFHCRTTHLSCDVLQADSVFLCPGVAPLFFIFSH